MDEDELYDFIITIRPQLHNRADKIVGDIIMNGYHKRKHNGIPQSVHSIIACIEEEVN